MLIKPKHIIPLILTCLLCFASVQPATSQSRVFIENAERAEGGSIDGENIRKLLGNVLLRTEEMVMQADSAYQFIDNNLIHAFNIQIDTEDEIIWADTMYYDTLTDYSEFRGRVIIESETNTVFSQMVDVSAPLDLAIFNTPVQFEDDTGTLLAESGLYFQEADSAVFRGDVQLSDSTQYLEADSLFMNRSKDLYELHGQVFADDFEEKVTFAGNYLLADSSGYRLLTGSDAWLMEVSENEADTTHLLAHTIELQENDTTSTMDAFGQVRIWSTKFSAIADTANYNDNDEQFILRGSPILWQNNIQLSGPRIEATLNDGEIEFLNSSPRPIAVQEDSSTGRLHQMAGDTLHAFFNSGELQRLVVFDNSEIIFHQKDDDDQPDGLLQFTAARATTLMFLAGEFDNLKANENIDGTYLPESPDLADRTLDNFQWNPERRPERPTRQMPRLPIIPDAPLFDLPQKYIIHLEKQIEMETIEREDMGESERSL